MTLLHLTVPSHNLGRTTPRKTQAPCVREKVTKSASDRKADTPRTGKMAARAYSITRAEIDGFWRRKEMEEEERRLASEKEAARIKAKTLEIEDYMLFEQMIREILEEGMEGDRARRTERGVTKNSTETRIGIKHWWRSSSYAYLNEPAVTTPMDENGRNKQDFLSCLGGTSRSYRNLASLSGDFLLCFRGISRYQTVPVGTYYFEPLDESVMNGSKCFEA